MITVILTVGLKLVELLLLGKHHSQRKLTRKVSCPRARFNDRLELTGWLGKDGVALTLG
jgi:hypothetical protein